MTLTRECSSHLLYNAAGAVSEMWLRDRRAKLSLKPVRSLKNDLIDTFQVSKLAILRCTLTQCKSRMTSGTKTVSLDEFGSTRRRLPLFETAHFGLVP